LLKLYRSHIISKLDYGCTIYGSACRSNLQSLDTVQSAALRVCLGSCKTSPIPSLHVEAGEPPAELRRQKLSLQYLTKLASDPGNPAHNHIFKSNFETLFAAKPGLVPTLGIRMKDQLLATDIKVDSITKFIRPGIPPWKMKAPTFLFALRELGHKTDTPPHEFQAKFIRPCIPPWKMKAPTFLFALRELGHKTNTPPHEFQAKFKEILAIFKDYTHIYTDGSKDGRTVAAAAVSSGKTLTKRLPDHASIFSAESQAIILAMDIAKQSSNTKILILSDSLSCLQSVQNRNLNNPFILNIITEIHTLIESGKQIFIMWIPSHIGLPGNSAADAAAKAALNHTTSKGTVPYSDFKSTINSYTLSYWQLSWDLQTGNKLRNMQLYPKLDLWNRMAYHAATK
jgi:ribonuclease HI